MSYRLLIKKIYIHKHIYKFFYKGESRRMEKLAVAMINHKGGVGKTTLAYVLSQIALSRGLAVSAVDLDPQRNLTDALFLLQKTNEKKFKIFSKLVVTDKITDEGDIIIIDCPPALRNQATEAAIDFADITLIPVIPDLFSLVNLSLVYKLGKDHEKSKEQLAIVKVGFDKRALVDTISTNINDRQYNVAGEVPINRLITYNILYGRFWHHGLSAAVREPFNQLFDRTIKAYDRMLNGKFDDAWK